MAEHYRVGRLVAQSADLLLAYGKDSQQIIIGAVTGGMSQKCAVHYEDQEEMAASLKRLAKPGDILLFKGSRGMHMEKVLQMYLEQEKNS